MNCEPRTTQQTPSLLTRQHGRLTRELFIFSNRAQFHRGLAAQPPDAGLVARVLARLVPGRHLAWHASEEVNKARAAQQAKDTVQEK
ncbi:hypothetical protein MAPG_05177 [Magnaporthiopsis poae ATCC 64411]|uniref:Uncharacterized protein n=1 Tax=Magnaporthiopsis poae (strain ATCC 64411 / 73-15) TaxID=644358 RepID=A0A0C4DYQ1_MAGP6|nr:hypothetical protein MAPG_05177 [Magnaporthiopsis poae ATCC 64411]